MESSPKTLDAEELAGLRQWRVCFWLIFFATPVLTLLASAGFVFVARWLSKSGGIGAGFSTLRMLMPLGFLGVLALGCLSAGYCFMKSRRKSSPNVGAVRQTVAYAAVVFVAYIASLMLFGAMVNKFMR